MDVYVCRCLTAATNAYAAMGSMLCEGTWTLAACHSCLFQNLHGPMQQVVGTFAHDMAGAVLT
jgi:hypothetical protein